MRFERDDLVLLPSGRKALVISIYEDERVECEYVDEPYRTWARVCLAMNLLRIIERGRPLPDPVRIVLATPT